MIFIVKHNVVKSLKTYTNTRGSINSELKQRKLVKMNLAASLPEKDRNYELHMTPEK